MAVWAPVAATPVTAVPTRGKASPFTTFQRFPLLVTSSSPLKPTAIPRTKVIAAFTLRGMGGNWIVPVTSCWSRSTIAIDSPPVVAT